MQETDPKKIAAAHESWYAAQPLTNCRNCDRTFPNVDHGKTEYCCLECELGFFRAKAEIDHVVPKSAKHRRKKHLGYSSYRSNWS